MTIQQDAAVSSRRVTANGYRIHLLEAGSGPLVLMLHGFPETSHSWRHQLPALAEAGYHAVAIDMLGYGRSSKPTVSATRITELVRTVTGVVEALGHSKAVVVGHDWGAPVAWTAAWIQPDVFEAVAGVSVAFSGRGLMGLPGSPFGEMRPSRIESEIAGSGRIFYQQYFSQPGTIAREAEPDIRGWLNRVYYGISAAAPLPTFSSLSSDEEVVALLRETAICLQRGKGFSDDLIEPEAQPEWLSLEDLDIYAAEFERAGLETALHSYRTNDLDWELLAPFEGRPLEVPALFVGGDRDLPTLWARDAINRMSEVAIDVRGRVIIDDCGHWVQQEKPDEFNRALLDFLNGVRPIGNQ